MRDVPTNSAWVASITRAAERDEQRRTNPMTTATDTERDEVLSQLADLTDTFGYESVRNMLDTLERNDLTAQRSEQP